MGALHPPRGRRHTLFMGSPGRREGRATRGVLAAELARASLGRRARTARRGRMTLTISLPVSGAGATALRPYTLSGKTPPSPAKDVRFNRVAYSAAHVVADPLATRDPWVDCALDWDATIAYRVHLWKLGLGVAEAMDTAQRGMGLDWPTSLELIRQSIGAARGIKGALLASGCGTDHLLPEAAHGLDYVIGAYEDQMAAIEAAGGRLILMASRALARIARGPD